MVHSDANLFPSHIKPSLELLKSYIGGEEKVLASVKIASWFLPFDLKRNLQPNIDFLIKEGVPVNLITKKLHLFAMIIVHRYDRNGMVCAVNAARDLGLEPKAPSFIMAVAVKLSMSESTWNKKLEVFTGFGWNEPEILSVFKRRPSRLGCSENNIKSSMDFLANTARLEPKDILTYPRLLLSSIDKRIRPTYNVLKILKSKKLINEECKVACSLNLAEKTFVDKYVTKDADKVPGLLITRMQNG